MCRSAIAALLWSVTFIGIFAVTVVSGQEAPATHEATPPAYWRGEPLHIGNQTQLLVDDYIVEDRWKLTRRVGNVLKSLRNPVIVRDEPWEAAVGDNPCVLYDARLHKFRMWYGNFSLTNYFTHNGPSYYMAYAESDDGVNWIKPRLEGFPFGGYRSHQHRDERTGRQTRQRRAGHAESRPVRPAAPLPDDVRGRRR